MKTLFAILLISLSCVMGNANPRENSDYLLTSDGKFIVANIHFGLFRLHAVLEDGAKMKFKFDEVKSYRLNGETYVRLPIYRGREKSNQTAFMKLVSWRNGLGLYLYEDYEREMGKNERYLVYKDDNTFWLDVTSSNQKTVIEFFSEAK